MADTDPLSINTYLVVSDRFKSTVQFLDTNKNNLLKVAQVAQNVGKFGTSWDVGFDLSDNAGKVLGIIHMKAEPGSNPYWELSDSSGKLLARVSQPSISDSDSHKIIKTPDGAPLASSTIRTGYWDFVLSKADTTKNLAHGTPGILGKRNSILGDQYTTVNIDDTAFPRVLLLEILACMFWPKR